MGPNVEILGLICIFAKYVEPIMLGKLIKIKV
jgi:hypothetical protein